MRASNEEVLPVGNFSLQNRRPLLLHWRPLFLDWSHGTLRHGHKNIIKLIYKVLFLQCISVRCCKNLMAQACFFWPRVLLVQNSPPGLATTAGKYSLQQSPYIQQQISKVVLTYLRHLRSSCRQLVHYCYWDLQWTLENIH